MVSAVAGFLDSESDWKREFTNVIADEMKKGHVNNEHFIKNRIPLLNETNADGKEIPSKKLPEIKGFETDIFSRLEEMIYSYEKPHLSLN